MSPVEGTLRGFGFEPSAFTANNFYVNAFFLPLCVPVKRVHFTFGRRIGKQKRWSTDDPHLEAALTSEMLSEARFLSGLRRPADLVKALEPLLKRGNPHAREAFAYSLIHAGETARALETLGALLNAAEVGVTWQGKIAMRAQLIRDKLLKDLSQAQKQLRAWEADTVSSLGLSEFR